MRGYPLLLSKLPSAVQSYLPSTAGSRKRRKEAPAVSGTEAREKLTNKAKHRGESDVLRVTAGKGDCYWRDSLQHDGVALNCRDCLVEGDCWLPAAIFSQTGTRRRGLLSSKRKFRKCGKNTGAAWQNAWAVSLEEQYYCKQGIAGEPGCQKLILS